MSNQLGAAGLGTEDIERIVRRTYAALNTKHGDPSLIRDWELMDSNQHEEYRAEVLRVLDALSAEGFVVFHTATTSSADGRTSQSGQSIAARQE